MVGGGGRGVVGGGGRGVVGGGSGGSGRRVWAPAVEDLNVDDTAFLINALIHGHKHKINKPEQTVQITISITFVTLVNIPLNHSNPKNPEVVSLSVRVFDMKVNFLIPASMTCPSLSLSGIYVQQVSPTITQTPPLSAVS